MTCHPLTRQCPVHRTKRLPQLKNRYGATSRSAVLADPAVLSRLKNRISLALRRHVRSRLRALLTIERTCPARVSWCLPHRLVYGVERFAYDPTDRGFQRLSFLQIPFSSEHLNITWGQLPPARKGQRGHFIGCCGFAASDLRTAKCVDRSLRVNGLKPLPDKGVVGHSCDLPIGHSCDLPIDLISII